MFEYRLRYLTIVGYQGIENLNIKLIDGVNMLVGGGNVGKTTILNATRLVLVQDQSLKLTQQDYYEERVDCKFKIEAQFHRVSKQSTLPTSSTVPPLDGLETVTPSIVHQTDTKNDDYAFTLVAIGTKNMELKFENDKAEWISNEEFQAAMNTLKSTNIIGHDNSSRDLRYLSTGNELEARNHTPETSSVEDSITPAAENNVTYRLQPIQVDNLNHAFIDYGFPYSAQFTTPIVAVNGNFENLKLVDKRSTLSLPFSIFGNSAKSTVQRVIEELNQPSGPIRLVDCFENQMDTPTQRIYYDHFTKNKGQSLIATSSSEILRMSDNCAVWFVGRKGKAGRMVGSRITQHKKSHPSSFLSHFVIIGEGATEVGFVNALLKIVLGQMPEFYGIIVNDGTGHEFTKDLVAQMLNSGHKVGAFVDFEKNNYKKTWDDNKERAKKLIFQWEEGCMEENYILKVPSKYLMDFISHPVKGAQERLRTIAARINFFPDSGTKLTIKLIKAKISEMPESKNLPPAQRETAVHEKFVQLMIDAATGKIPTQKFKLKEKDFKQHERSWFKSIEGGMELAEKLFTCGVWDAGMKKILVDFLNAIRSEVGLETT